MTASLSWLSLHTSQVAHQARAYPAFCRMSSHYSVGELLLPSRWNASPLQSYPRHFKFADTNLYTWEERGTVRVMCLSQEHNAMKLART